ncbi:MAG: tail fiber domain-containing protein [Lentisphaeria bacterium]|nr:tail fiber domain-containing protein [Lentisphaeria bacterium]
MKITRFLTGTLICTGLITAGLTQAQITLDTSVPSPGTGSILVDQGGGVAAWEDAAGGGQGPQGKQGDPGPVGSEFWDGDIAGDIYKVNSGNVGIGTTTPTSLLHISGSEPSAIRMSGTRPTYGPRDYLFGLQAGNLNTGDPGMRLQTVDATAGLIRTILDAQGFFGIGDLTPAARLHVNESPNVAGSLGGQLFRITGHEPSMQIEATRNATTWNIGGNMSGLDDNGMRLVIGNNHMGTAMAINQVGRVGIGAETPVAKLHVMEMPENSGDQGLLLRLTGREPRMELEAQRTGVTWSIAANYTGGDQGMRLRIANSDSGPALTINQPGRVGIGTDVPTAKLDVVGQVKISGGNPGAGKVLTSDADGLATWEDAGAGAQGPQGKQGPAGTDGAAGDSQWIPSEAANPIAGIWTAKAVGIGMGRGYGVWEEGSGDKIDLQILADAGSGGYGTTADPAGVLRFILKDFSCFGGESLGQIQWYGNEANIAGGSGRPRASIEAKYIGTAGQTTMYFNVAEGPGEELVERLVINQVGYIGQGGQWPLHPLHMASDAHVTSGGVWTNASSRDMKENIAELSTEEAVEALTALTPVKYNYKKEQDEEYVGFIAEDVPALVATNNRKNLSPMDVVGVLTKVVQEQQLQMEAMKVELEELKNLQN